MHQEKTEEFGSSYQPTTHPLLYEITYPSSHHLNPFTTHLTYLATGLLISGWVVAAAVVLCVLWWVHSLPIQFSLLTQQQFWSIPPRFLVTKPQWAKSLLVGRDCVAQERNHGLMTNRLVETGKTKRRRRRRKKTWKVVLLDFNVVGELEGVVRFH